MRKILYFLISLLLITSTSWATVYCVDGTNGSDSNSGLTVSAAYQTIAKGITSASAGDTILILPGTYSGIITINKSGTHDNPITLMSYSNNSDNYAVIDGGGVYGNVGKWGIHISSQSWIVLKNLKFQNCWNSNIHGYNSSYITVKNCSGVGGRNFYAFPGSSSHHILIEDSLFSDIRAKQVAANSEIWILLYQSHIMLIQWAE